MPNDKPTKYNLEVSLDGTSLLNESSYYTKHKARGIVLDALARVVDNTSLGATAERGPDGAMRGELTLNTILDGTNQEVELSLLRVEKKQK